VRKPKVNFTTVIASAGLAVAVTTAGLVAANAGTARLVYMCTDTQGHTSNCANRQEFEVFDRNGAPILSVGETGGSGVYGDNSSVYAPSSVTHPRVTVSYTDPATYARTFHRPSGCTAPATWVGPTAIWGCHGGAWAKKVNL